MSNWKRWRDFVHIHRFPKHRWPSQSYRERRSQKMKTSVKDVRDIFGFLWYWNVYHRFSSVGSCILCRSNQLLHRPAEIGYLLYGTVLPSIVWLIGGGIGWMIDLLNALPVYWFLDRLVNVGLIDSSLDRSIWKSTAWWSSSHNF